MKVGWDAPNERGRKTVDLGQMAITETREVCSADSSCSCHNLPSCWIFSTLAAHPPYFGLKTPESGDV